MKHKMAITAMTAVISSVCFAAPASAFTDGDYDYSERYNSELVITSYNGNEADIVLPETLNGKRVIGIDYRAFKYNDVIRSVTIPESYSFLHIGAFQFSTVREINIPHKIKELNNDVFKGCECLEKVEFSGDVSNLNITGHPFVGCHALKEIVFPKDCQKVTIGYETFAECAFDTLTIPCNCSLDNNSFRNNKKLNSVVFEGWANVGGMAFADCDALESVSFNNGGNVEISAFASLPKLKNIDISDDLTFSPRAFSYCLDLMNINSEPAFDSKTGDFNSKYKDFILKNFNGAQDVGFINEYVKANVKRVANEVTNDSMSDIQKARALHDWICANTEYDTDNINADRNHHDASVFMNTKTVCEGYASLYDLLLREAGIESYYVHSNDHAWNILNIDGHYFHSDTTWDDQTSSYKWFMCSDSELQKAVGAHSSWKLLVPSVLHVYDRTSAPPCEYGIGDTNTDGDVNVADLVGLSRFLHGTSSPEKDKAVFYDVDSDGNTDALDVVSLRKKINVMS